MVKLYQGDHGRATALLTEGLTLARELDEKKLIILPLINLGMMAWHQGDYVRAAVLLTESLAAAQEAEDMTLTAWSLRSLGMVSSLQGDHDRATALYIKSLSLSCELDDWWGMTECIEGLAWARAASGMPRTTRRASGGRRDCWGPRWRYASLLATLCHRSIASRTIAPLPLSAPNSARRPSRWHGRKGVR